jgi:hypothetical protein
MAETMAELNKNGIGEPIQTATFNSNGLNCTCTKKGDIKCFSFSSGTIGNAISANGVVVTLPVAYTPSVSFEFTDTVNPSVRLRLRTDGTIITIGALSANTALRSGVVYF